MELTPMLEGEKPARTGTAYLVTVETASPNSVGVPNLL